MAWKSAPEQLQGEVLEGSWYSLRAEGKVIFDRDAENFWKRPHERAAARQRGKPDASTLQGATLGCIHQLPFVYISDCGELKGGKALRSWRRLRRDRQALHLDGQGLHARLAKLDDDVGSFKSRRFDVQSVLADGKLERT